MKLNGVIDMHVHAAPDVKERIMNGYDLALAAKKAGMKGFVLKNHYSATMAEADVLSHALGIQVFGGITLNQSVGGLNPDAVEKAVRMKAKIIWMPTHDSDQERRFYKNPDKGIIINGKKNSLKNEVHDILSIIAENNVILATGHLSYEEILLLLKTAKEYKITKMLVNHPGIIFQRFSISLQLSMLAYDAMLEYSYARPPHTLSWDEMTKAIKEIGKEHIVLSTDLGQINNTDPVNGMKDMLLQLENRGIPEKDLYEMAVVNPGSLLNLT